jgi:multiple sugar transport system ATP-binding protein
VTTVTLQHVDITRDGARVVRGLDLEAPSGQRLVLLGPSGAGKSTVLRAIAGLERVSSGHVMLDGEPIDRLPTRDRDVSMVNQDASLLPHLDVEDNVGFPLKLRHLADQEIVQRVQAEADARAIKRLLPKRPRTLSGGERHEVALARALVRRPRVLLLDEPMARIDRPRVAELLRDLIRVQEGFGVTLLATTNDQRIGMTLAHRLAVLRDGELQQVGDPMQVYNEPVNAFVAGFLGDPPMNLLPGAVRRGTTGSRIEAGPLRFPSFSLAVRDLVGRDVLVGVRPEHLGIPSRPDQTSIEEVVRSAVTVADRVHVEVGGRDGEQPLSALLPRPAPSKGTLLRLAIDPSRVHLFDAGTGEALVHGV